MMAVVKRGKGRGFIEIRETILRRPGQPFPTKFDDLINLINTLVIKDLLSDIKIDNIVQMINDLIKNNSLNDILNNLYKKALEDKEFGIKLAIICSNFKVYSINDYQWRSTLLSILQKNYEEREVIKVNNISHFRNAISFFGEVYNSLKLNGPLQFLAVPLLHYLEMLLENLEEDDLQLIIIQVSINGRNIYEDSPTLLMDFIMRIRSILINHNLTSRFRKMLLYVIDLANQRFTPLSGKIQEFYVNELGINTFVDIQRCNKNLTIDTEIEDNTNEHDNTPSDKDENKIVHPSTDHTFDNILMKAPL